MSSLFFAADDRAASYLPPERYHEATSGPAGGPGHEEVAGSVERIVFHNPDSGYCVLKVKVEGRRRHATVIGFAPYVFAGEAIEARGSWDEHPEFGVRFTAHCLRTRAPSLARGAEKYLGSGMIKGIGPSLAAKLVAHFGVNIFEVMDSHPDLLRDVPGIGPARVEKIVAAWREQKAIREIMGFLHSHGIHPAKAPRIFKIYGMDAIARIEENPYCLARDIPGVGFRQADLLASHLGVSRDSMRRARAGIEYAVLHELKDGHCAIPRERLLAAAGRLLGIERAVLEAALALEEAEGAVVTELVEGEICCFNRALYDAEKGVATELRRIERGASAWRMLDAGKALAWLKDGTGFAISGGQADAVRLVLGNKITLITGGPGTGKTTLIRCLVDLFRRLRVSVAAASPTGRAAKRLSEATGFEASTVHRLLGFDPARQGFHYHGGRRLPFEVLILDEASMIDLELMHQLTEAIPDHAALILIGDIDQIPSVRAGRVFESLIESRRFPVAALTEIFRQEKGSQIIKAAHAINRGELPLAEEHPLARDFFFISTRDPETAMARVVELVRDRIPDRFGLDPLRDIQVLCPLNRGLWGGRRLNRDLQSALNPRAERRVERFGTVLSTGDKVLVTANDYEKDVFNGDVGIVAGIDFDGQRLVVDFEGRPVEFQFAEMDILQLAYAMTVHKAQGSEYEAVVIPITRENEGLLRRNLLYTAVTRGRRLVVIVGDPRVFASAVRDARQGGRRLSNLGARLAERGH